MSATKIALIAAGIGLIIYMGRQATRFADLVKFVSFKIVGLAGVPSITGGQLIVPLTARITNNSSQSLAVDHIKITASYLNANGQFVPAGQGDISAFTIMPGNTNKTLLAQINLKAFEQNLVDNLLSVLTAKSLRTKFDVRITVAGVPLPTQTLIEDIHV